MRSMLAGLVVLGLAFFSLPADAGSIQAPYGLNVFGGLATPTGTLAEFSNHGFSIGGSFTYQTSRLMALEIGAATGQRFSFDEAALGVPAGLVSGANVNVFSLTGGIRIGNSEAKVAPYGVVGAGLYRVGLSDTEITIPGLGTQTITGVSENAFGMNFGGGVQSQMSPSTSVFGEVRYHAAFTSGEATTYLPFNGGIRFQW